MNQITVDKAQLVEKLKSNRDEHRGIYETAVVIYREQAAEVAKDQAELLLKGKIRQIIVSLPVPEDHTDDFERALEMLKWHQGDVITLEEHEFAQYVQNEWGWKRSFAANTASYAGGLR